MKLFTLGLALLCCAYPCPAHSAGDWLQQGFDAYAKSDNPGAEAQQASANAQIRTEHHDDTTTVWVTVVDERQHYVVDLKSSDFMVYEDLVLQKNAFSQQEDTAASIGIIVDNSGSMREKRPPVAQAILNLVKASNPQDEFFVVNFNDESFLDQDFTSNPKLLTDAVNRLDPRGGTALYDAIIASANHLKKAPKFGKSVLLVITDGEDNSSTQSIEDVLRSVEDDNGPIVYAIGILGAEGRERRARRALEQLALDTGGVTFFPKNLTELNTVALAVADDIRNQYRISYKPSHPKIRECYRRIKVEFGVGSILRHKELHVRVKGGYFTRAPNRAPN